MGLYHEDHGATLKHKCGKRDSSIVPSLFFSHFYIFFVWAFSLFYGLFLFGLLWPLLFIYFFVRSLIPTYGGIIVSIILSSLGQWSNNDDHHTFIFLTTQQLELDT